MSVRQMLLHGRRYGKPQSLCLPSLTGSGLRHLATFGSPPPPRLPDDRLFASISPRAPFADLKTQQIAVALLTLQMCWLAPIAGPLFAICRRLRLSWVLRKTFMAHFCAGESPLETAAALNALSKRRMLPILDVAIEADLETPNAPADPCHALRFCEAIAIAARTQKACVAVKLTALVPTATLMRLSTALAKALHRSKCAQSSAAPLASAATASFNQTVALFDPTSTHAARRAALLLLGLPGSDMAPLMTLVRDISTLCHEAAKSRVALMVDAEQSYFQHGIDLVALHMAARFNTPASAPGPPVVYNTYQMYLRCAPARLQADMALANAQGWRFAAKIVRGAYMTSERARAAQLGYRSPVNDTIAETHAAYNSAIGMLLRAVATSESSGRQTAEDGSSVGAGYATATLGKQYAPSIIIASHNVDTITMAASLIWQHGISADRAAFAQLKGMHEVTGFALVQNGLRTYKYMPYGAIDEVMPYLIRRAQENSALMGSAGLDKQLLWHELGCRIREHLATPFKDEHC